MVEAGEEGREEGKAKNAGGTERQEGFGEEVGPFIRCLSR